MDCVVALPAPAAGRMLQALPRTLRDSCKAIRYSSTVIVQFAYRPTRRPEIAARIRRAGATEREKDELRAITFVHQKFDGRVPRAALLRIFLGGTADPSDRGS